MDLRLLYDKEAVYWDEALPVGNGRLGAMVYGGIEKEHLQLNEEHLWSGGPQDRINPDCLGNLERIRALYRQGRVDEAQRLAVAAMSGTPCTQRMYQTLGDLWIEMFRDDSAGCRQNGNEKSCEAFNGETAQRAESALKDAGRLVPGNNGEAEAPAPENNKEAGEPVPEKNREAEAPAPGNNEEAEKPAPGNNGEAGEPVPEEYERFLDLEQAVVRVKYRVGDTVYRRSYFASRPADCLVIRMTAEGSRRLSCVCRLDRRQHLDYAGHAEGGALICGGSRGGIGYALGLRVLECDGQTETLGDHLIVRGASEMTLIFTAAVSMEETDRRKEASVRKKADTGEWAETAVPCRRSCSAGLPWGTGKRTEAADRVLEQLDAVCGGLHPVDQCLDARRVLEQMEAVCGRQCGADELFRDHVKDYRDLFDRVRLILSDGMDMRGVPGAVRESMTTDARLRRLAAGESDPELMALYFQYGRYLMIAGSRPGGLPLTLQGIWNEEFMPAWDSKYTININLEMNYWPADVCGLSECGRPFFDLLRRVCESGKETARRMYGCRGFVAHHNTDVHADTAPQGVYIPASYWVMGGAWLSLHIWEHYLFTRDREFLAGYFDILREAVLFFRDFLRENERGQLVTLPSVSPENGYLLDGRKVWMCEMPAMDVEILGDLLRAYRSAAETLGIDKDPVVMKAAEHGEGPHPAEPAESSNEPHAAEPAESSKMPRPVVSSEHTEDLIAAAGEMLARIPRLQIASDGRLMEWNEEYEEPEPGHRHISHLFGLFPSSQITPEDTPDLAEAARRSLEYRLAHGGGHTGWSRAWIILFWARLRNGEKAYENLRALLADSTFDNLMDNHPDKNRRRGRVFQIDGNMGAAAGIAEMLVQSHNGRIRILPALPEAWPDGSVRGLRVRGNAEVSIIWNKGVLTRFELKAYSPFAGKAVYRGEEREIRAAAGETFCWEE